MARVPLMAANWKMNKTVAEGVALAKALAEKIASLSGPEVVVCPPATALYAVGQDIAGTKLALGAQDIFWEAKGAYTGMLAPEMLKDVSCSYVIVGHSERRGRFGKSDLTPELLSVFGDNDTTVNRKAQVALANDLKPIICVGETLAERQAGNTDSVIAAQLEKALQGLSADAADLIVAAYEPVWAIGTGETCDPIEANRVIAMMRGVVATVMGDEAAAKMRLLYGGSVTADNSDVIMEQSDIDGVLVGGASLDAEKFARIAFSGTKKTG